MENCHKGSWKGTWEGKRQIKRERSRNEARPKDGERQKQKTIRETEGLFWSLDVFCSSQLISALERLQKTSKDFKIFQSWISKPQYLNYDAVAWRGITWHPMASHSIPYPVWLATNCHVSLHVCSIDLVNLISLVSLTKSYKHLCGRRK